MVSFILPGNSASGEYEVANSCRFNDGSSDNLVRTNASATNNTKYTYSVWVKRATLGTNQSILYNWYDGSNHAYIFFATDDKLALYDQLGGTDNINMKTSAVFRDVSAWYNIVVKVDTTESTQADRVRVFINGVEDSIGTRSSQPGSSASLGMKTNSLTNYMAISSFVNNSSNYLDGYIAEAVYIDGQALDPTSFGEFDEDSPNIWKPIDVSGLTFGNNGFYLDFEDSSALGNDKSGNDNDFTANNLSATNQSEDTCTNNYAIMNPALPLFSSDFRNGAVEWRTTTNSQYYWANSTIGVSQGKWYIEAKLQTAADHNYFGISADQPDDNTTFLAGGGGAGGANDLYEWGWKSSDGKIYNNTDGGTSYGSTYTSGDILGMYLDLDNNKLYFAKNGTIQNSGTGISITDPASTPNGVYFIAVGDGTSSNSCIWEVGFGNPSYGVSSANTDPNGYGTFEYSPNDGGSSSFDSAAKDFYALNTKNLAEFG